MPRRSRGHSLGRAFAAFGTAVAVVALMASPSDARSAAAQDGSPFVLVAGLLLIGLVADGDGLFATVGDRLARTLRNGGVLFVGATAMVGLVAALLNLDTSLAFSHPVLVYTARSRGDDEAALVYGCLMLSNAGSLFLPGSNLELAHGQVHCGHGGRPGGDGELVQVAGRGGRHSGLDG